MSDIDFRKAERRLAADGIDALVVDKSTAARWWAIRIPGNAALNLCCFHVTRREAIQELVDSWGHPWKVLYRMGFRAVRVLVVEASRAGDDPS